MKNRRRHLMLLRLKSVRLTTRRTSKKRGRGFKGAEDSKAGDDLDPAKSIKTISVIMETLHTIFPPSQCKQDLSLSQHN
ncbi:unnamed protein product [Brassica napus]|uniref:(rape) hypothetical protein n=1 Tax=Brassica napus TaxID=3708 RepID=A0A816W9S5_BRANA|nr:unnamed protein product [Brassica napus]